MNNRGFLNSLLDATDEQVFLRSLLIFRVPLLGTTVMVWGDESSHFSCDTEQRCCKSICSEEFPLKFTFFWFYQLMFVCHTILFYLWYVLFMNPTEQNKEEHDKMQLLGDSGHGQDRPLMQDGEGNVHISRARLQPYIISIIFRILSEAGLIAGQHYLYGFGLKHQYHYDYLAYPHNVDCFAPQYKENFVIILLLATACLSFFLNVLEIWYLGGERLKYSRTMHFSPDSSEFKVSATTAE